MSPDGSFIVFASGRSGNGDLYRIDVDGSGLTRLTTHPGFDGDPAISPDGGRIAFSSDFGRKRDIYLMDIHGRHPRRLTRETGDAYEPAFSPDGKRITYTACGDGYSDICVTNLDGRGRKVLTNNWLRYKVYQRLGNNKVSQFLRVTGRYCDYSPAWAPAE